MRYKDKNYRTVWMEGHNVHMIDQQLLPFDFRIKILESSSQTAKAIKHMTVRGAGAIGATAGYAMAQAIGSCHDYLDWETISYCRKEIEATRPTAQNLFYATKRVYDAAYRSSNPIETAIRVAQEIADEDVESCKRIGENSVHLIPEGGNVLTHCNAGWLAFVDYGSALSPIYVAHNGGKKVHVYVDETRPRSQGAKLTAWELYNEKVPHTIIPDNAAAHYMSRGEIDLVIVGADRIARNGDVANKIGTLEKAIVAKAFGVPFYVAAPSSTIDWECESGKDIPIEERDQNEVLYQKGPTPLNNTLEKVLVCNPGSNAKNPAFDVTPEEYISAIITEQGIFDPKSLKKN